MTIYSGRESFPDYSTDWPHSPSVEIPSIAEGGKGGTSHPFLLSLGDVSSSSAVVAMTTTGLVLNRPYLPAYPTTNPKTVHPSIEDGGIDRFEPVDFSMPYIAGVSGSIAYVYYYFDEDGLLKADAERGINARTSNLDGTDPFLPFEYLFPDDDDDDSYIIRHPIGYLTKEGDELIQLTTTNLNLISACKNGLPVKVLVPY